MQIITFNMEGLGECICEFKYESETNKCELISIKLKVDYAYILIKQKTRIFKLRVEAKIIEALNKTL